MISQWNTVKTTVHLIKVACSLSAMRCNIIGVFLYTILFSTSDGQKFIRSDHRHSVGYRLHNWKTSNDLSWSVPLIIFTNISGNRAQIQNED